jgi:predicted GNAT family acetyltransferase
MSAPEVVDNAAAERYEATVDGGLAFLEYERRPGTVVLIHTEVPPAAEGHGVGQALVRHALDQARANGQRVIVRCPFVRSWISRHPEYADLVQPPMR